MAEQSWITQALAFRRNVYPRIRPEASEGPVRWKQSLLFFFTAKDSCFNQLSWQAGRTLFLKALNSTKLHGLERTGTMMVVSDDDSRQSSEHNTKDGEACNAANTHPRHHGYPCRRSQWEYLNGRKWFRTETW